MLVVTSRCNKILFVICLPENVSRLISIFKISAENPTKKQKQVIFVQGHFNQSCEPNTRLVYDECELLGNVYTRH